MGPYRPRDWFDWVLLIAGELTVLGFVVYLVVYLIWRFVL
jgi:hypothetical protein